MEDRERIFAVLADHCRKRLPCYGIAGFELRESLAVCLYGRPIERAVEGRADEQAQVVQGYCAAIRSALTDDGHPPLSFSGLQLHERVQALDASLTRLGEKGGRCPSH